jgi:AcrR family transcriptional regulator
MDADQIVSAAVRLTNLHGLDQWTIRQLGEELNCWPSVIYHHVGDRDAVVTDVVDRIVGMVRPVDESLPWRQSFEETLSDLWIKLRMHPGVARWLTLTGPVVPSAVRDLDRGVRILTRAGLGDEAPLAYLTTLNAALLMIALEEDWAERSAASELRDVLAEYRGSQAYPGVAAAASFVDSWDFGAIYSYGVARQLDGIATRLGEVAGT